ncbi:MAG: hypothetical protein C5B53_05005 [Candidatus Melainabacteria bacterium]|nr:MAG: hypothetical protein C5B53_05005 [Candidatus Melainabacteria bacterium]
MLMRPRIKIIILAIITPILVLGLMAGTGLGLAHYEAQYFENHDADFQCRVQARKTELEAKWEATHPGKKDTTNANVMVSGIVSLLAAVLVLSPFILLPLFTILIGLAIWRQQSQSSC